MGEKNGKSSGKQKKTIPGWMNFVIGGASGMMGICIVQPMDLMKTRMQLLGPAAKTTSTLTVAKGILKNEGFIGFYTGISAALLRQATYTTGRLGCFNVATDFYKRLVTVSFTVSQTGGVPNFGIKLLMGMFSGGVGAFFGTPAEVALIRMTADGRLPKEKRRNYHHIFNALGRIVKEEGVTTLWRGAVATMTRAMVVNGVQLGTYAQSREMLLPRMGDGLHLHATSSMIAGFLTSAASLPVDIIKTRVQNSAKGTSQGKVLASIIKNEGVFALWNGFIPTWSKIGPHTVFTFIFMEQLNKIYLQNIA